MAVPTLLHGCENWVLFKQHDRRTEKAEMKLLRPVAGYTVYDYKTNEETRKELNTYNLNEIIVDYKHKRMQRLSRMNDTRIPRMVYEYNTTVKRNADRPRKRWKDQHP
jgi:hypothetical protein